MGRDFGRAVQLCRRFDRGMGNWIDNYTRLAEGDAPDFVEVSEAGIAVDHVMRRQRAVQRSW